MSATMKLTAENVHAVFLDCFHTEEELKNPLRRDEYIPVDGLTMNIGFHPGKIAKNKQNIADMLAELAPEFMKNGGGGWTFLYMGKDKEGKQWASSQKTMEELVVLGLATGQITMPLPREFWPSLPGGVPYICVDLENFDV